ncbi:Retrotransposon Tca5 Polyprotein [Phytophthora megakarya]|uniref:Retrotransposon Tca5 Polyprotein n=1 Tax=Phytophthora megakarya TaxID=4795 RepID=A0A225VCZ7_9STRA|nr:Retrotransposon Tca5 Polyprotein [Phytophthora megakarya]
MDLLKKFDMIDCSIVATLPASSIVLEKETKLSAEAIAAQPFDSWIGWTTHIIVYDGTNKEVVYDLHTDVSFANTNEDCKSVTGYVSILADARVSWKSCRQDMVSLHTAQPELVAVSDGVK